jgi:thioredoxin reductase (NADPH)
MVHQIENYPGFPEGINGAELASRMEAQAKRFGADILQKRVEEVRISGGEFILRMSSGDEFIAKAVIIATGSKPKQLGIKGEQEFFGRGVSYCATCDGGFFRGEDVAVIGGGDSAIQEALYLSQICRTVNVIHRREQLRAKKILEERAKERGNLNFYLNTIPEEIIGGDAGVSGLRISDRVTGEKKVLNVSGVFIYVGLKPETELVRGLVKLTEDGFIIAGEDTKTSVPGIFAVGDVRFKKAKQVSSAVADGCNSALAVEEYFLKSE